MEQPMENSVFSLLWPDDSAQSMPARPAGLPGMASDLEVDVLVGELSVGR